MVAVEHVRVPLGEHVRFEHVADDVLHLLVARPDVPQIHRLAVGPDAERAGHEVGVHGAGQGVGDHQRRRGEEVHLGLRVDATLEVAVAGEHGAHVEVVRGDRVAHLGDQRSRVADAGGAAVPDEIEAQLVEVGSESGLVVVVGHHARAGGQRGLHPRLGTQAQLHGLLRHEPRADHHRRIRGVGAGGNRRDHHVPVVHAHGAAVGERHRRRIRWPDLVRFRLGAVHRMLALLDLAERDRVAGGEGFSRGLVQPPQVVWRLASHR